jgi:hypothetical protein
MIDSTTILAERRAAGEKANVSGVERRSALWFGTDRVTSKLAHWVIACGGFGSDLTRPLPNRVLISSTPSFLRFAMRFSSG